MFHSRIMVLVLCNYVFSKCYIQYYYFTVPYPYYSVLLFIIWRLTWSKDLGCNLSIPSLIVRLNLSSKFSELKVKFDVWQAKFGIGRIKCRICHFAHFLALSALERFVCHTFGNTFLQNLKAKKPAFSLTKLRFFQYVKLCICGLVDQ